jgi:hypothetical protein
MNPSVENSYASADLENSTDHPELFKTNDNISMDSPSSPFQFYDRATETYQTEYTGGRMDDIDIKKTYPQFEMYQENQRGPEKNFEDSLIGIIDNSILSRVYFSRKNIDNIQTKIISGVYNKSQGSLTVGKQSDAELKIIMRSIYLQESKNVDCKIQEQISQLNALVLEYCVGNIMVNATQYVNYIRELKKPTSVMENPSHTSISGTKTLSENHFVNVG